MYLVGDVPLKARKLIEAQHGQPGLPQPSETFDYPLIVNA